MHQAAELPCASSNAVIARSLSAEEALMRVQRAFDTRNDGGRRSPETEEQVRARGGARRFCVGPGRARETTR